MSAMIVADAERDLWIAALWRAAFDYNGRYGCHGYLSKGAEHRDRFKRMRSGVFMIGAWMSFRWICLN
jgi:hypothetical protein